MPGLGAGIPMPQNASMALGIGDLASQQMKDDLEQRRKKMTEGLSAGPGAYGDRLLGQASKDLLGL